MQSFNQLSNFYQKLFFLKDRNLGKQILKKHSHVICQQKNKLNYTHPYVSPSPRLVLSQKSFLTAMKQIFIYFFQSDEVGSETLTCQQI